MALLKTKSLEKLHGKDVIPTVHVIIAVKLRPVGLGSHLVYARRARWKAEEVNNKLAKTQAGLHGRALFFILAGNDIR